MESTSVCGPVSFTRDTCTEDDGHYSLTCFVVGESGRQWSALSIDDRQRKIVDHVEEVFGSRTKRELIPKPISILERQWPDGTLPVMPPNEPDSESGEQIGMTWENVLFIGTETADVWRGYMEGALRSGLRGAREVTPFLTKGIDQKRPRPSL